MSSHEFESISARRERAVVPRTHKVSGNHANKVVIRETHLIFKARNSIRDWLETCFVFTGDWLEIGWRFAGGKS